MKTVLNIVQIKRKKKKKENKTKRPKALSSAQKPSNSIEGYFDNSSIEGNDYSPLPSTFITI